MKFRINSIFWTFQKMLDFMLARSFSVYVYVTQLCSSCLRCHPVSLLDTCLMPFSIFCVLPPRGTSTCRLFPWITQLKVSTAPVLAQCRIQGFMTRPSNLLRGNALFLVGSYYLFYTSVRTAYFESYIYICFDAKMLDE